MPGNFNTQLPTVQVGPGSFREQAYVDSEGDLTGLDKALEGAAELSNQVVVARAEADIEKTQVAQEETYSKARALKRNIYEAGIQGDTKAELQFQAQLEDLKVAERQGAISGSNSSIRQESVLKSYINRFPHLEERFRKSYSSTRARAEASREQFEDPIEAGVDAAIKAATAEGKTVGAYLNEKNLKDKLAFDMQNLEYKAKLGASLEVDVDVAFQSTIVPLAVSSAQTFISAGVREFSQKGIDYDGNKAKADFIARGKLEAATAVGQLYKIAKSSNNPNAQISRTFLDERRAQIEKVYSDIAETGVFDSFDSLKSMQRSMEIGSIRSIQELGRFSPVLAEIAKRNPEQAGEIIFKDFSRSMELYKKGRRDLLSALGDNATNAIDAARLKYQLAIIDQWGGNELAADFRGFTQEQSFKPSGDQGVDAAKLSIMVQTVLGSDKTSPEEKASGVKAALDAEKNYSQLESFSPSGVWYKDPIRRKTLQTNKEAKEYFSAALDNAAAGLVSGDLQKLVGSGSFNFAPQHDLEDPRQPWKLYGTGGPFGAPKSVSDVGKGFTENQAVATNTIRQLNDMYWNYYAINGLAQADKWAFNLLNEAKTVQEENEAATKAEEGGEE